MFSKYSRLKYRRKFRARKKSVKNSAEDANKQLERHLFRRGHNWGNARRFVIGWVGLLVILGLGVTMQIRGLGSTYLVVQPATGGVYTEGIVGNLNNANPLYATSSVDNAVSSLVFSSLLTYNKDNQLVGDLATGWKLSDNEKEYTVTLRDDVYWHDGEKFDANDVIYTYNTIKDSDAQSQLYTTWRPVKIAKVDDYTVKFTLPNALSPFPHSLTNGIVPEHKLKGTEPSQLRSSKFNTEPVGSGPFKWSDVIVSGGANEKQENIQLVKNNGYFKSEVQLDGFNIKTYTDKDSMQEALESRVINAATGTDYYEPGNNNIESKLFNQNSQLMLFLNTKRPLTNNLELRKALIKATEVSKISQKLEYPTIPVREPILRGELGYNEEYKQLPPNPKEVNDILTAAGWLWAEGDQYRKKDGKELTIQLISENTPDYSHFSEEIQNQWARFGIKTNVLLEDPDDIVTTSLESKEYDVLLYAINIGADPDVYVYWHSSQAKQDAKPGFNLSRYESAKADVSLEAGRSRTDKKLRAEKYKPFLQAWKADIPAIGIHQPVFIYTTNVKVYNQPSFNINTPSDRYRNVADWQINTVKTNK